MVIADSGALYALADRSDAWHERVRGWWEHEGEEVRAPVTVLPEVAYLISRRIGPKAELAFVEAIAAGDVAVEELEPVDIARAAELMDAYLDVPIGFVDATVAAVAERLEVGSILTTDRRHFSLIRPAHARAFRLVP